MKLTKRPAGSAAARESATDAGPAPAGSRATVVAVPTAIAKPRVAHRLTRPADDCEHTGILAGKKALVFGVANDHSIAWGIAKALYDQGASVGFSSMHR